MLIYEVQFRFFKIFLQRISFEQMNQKCPFDKFLVNIGFIILTEHKEEYYIISHGKEDQGMRRLSRITAIIISLAVFLVCVFAALGSDVAAFL